MSDYPTSYSFHFHMHIYLNGQWVGEQDARISIMDLAVLRGFGIFDFLRTYGKQPFRLSDHLDRFARSARLMGMTPVHSKEEMTEIILEGIEKNGFEHTNIKLIQTGGISPDGFLPAKEQTFFIYFYEAHEYPAEEYEQGISLVTSPLMRQLPEAKTINYAASIAEVMQAHTKGAADILHTDSTGNIYEATRSNFFAVKEGTLITADKGILLGITRKVILEMTKRLNIPVTYRFITVQELDGIDEAFISNSSHEIVPVTRMNGSAIGQGDVGPLTKRLMQELKQIIQLDSGSRPE